MKIVDRKAFLALPPNTVYAKLSPRIADQAIAIKMESVGRNGYYSLALTETRESTTSEDRVGPLNLRMLELDCDHETQLFAVFEPQDVVALIARLQKCVHSGA